MPDDPSELIPLPPPAPDNPLSVLNDFELERATTMLRLICGRNKTVFKERNRKYVCLLWRSLDAEKKRRNPLVL